MSEQKTPMTLLERYGRAILRLEQWQWDGVIGPKPDEFDDLPIEERIEIIKPRLKEVREIAGPVVESYFRHKIDFEGSDREWLEWRKREVERKKQEDERYRLFLLERIESTQSHADKPDSRLPLLLSFLLGAIVAYLL